MHAFGLRTKLLAGALLATLPLLIAVLVLPPRIEAVLTQQGHERLSQTARDLATLAEQVLTQHREVVQGVASIAPVVEAIHARNSGQLDPAGVARLNHQLGAILASLSPHYQGLWTANASGIIFAGTLKNGDTAPYAHLDVHDRAYFTAARSSRRPVISEPMISKVGNVPIVVITVPLAATNGDFAGLVGLSVEVDYLAQIIASQKLGETGYPFAIDRHGLMIAHPDPERVMKLDFTQVPGAQRTAQRMLAGETGVENYVSSQGEAKIAAFAPVPSTGWSVAAGQETAEFTAPIRRLRSFLFLLIGACLAAASVVAIGFAARITRPIRDVSRTLAAATQVMDVGTSEIATGSNTLAANASHQAAGVEQTSASLTELTATTRSNADRATEASQLTQASGARMQSAANRMQELATVVHSAAEASEQTRKVMKTIDEIAFQTNILALNAAVEAARAGEAGMGFAVVADEVRNLAGRAASAARESANTLQLVGDLVQRSRELAGSTSEEFSSAQTAAQKIGGLVQEIATACREQSSALDQVNRSLAQFEQGAQGSAAHAEEAAAAAQELRAQAVSIRHGIDTLEHLVAGHTASSAQTATAPSASAPSISSAAPLIRPSLNAQRPSRRAAPAAVTGASIS